MPVRGQLPTFGVWVVWAWLGAVGLVFAGQLLQNPFVPGEDLIILWGAKINPAIAEGQWWRLVTPIFIHGSLLHFLANGYSLFVLGPGLERFYGAGRFSMLFLLSGVAGVTASYWFNASPSVGASGAIFGLIGAHAVLLYRNRDLLGEQGRASLQSILLIAGINLLFGFTTTFIDNWGHIGGLVGGLALAWFIGPVWQWPEQAILSPDWNVTLADPHAHPLRTLGVGALAGLVLLALTALGGLGRY